MKKLELVLVIFVVTLFSFPTIYMIVLLQSGNAKLVFKGDLARMIELHENTKVAKHSANQDSLILKNSYSYIANVEEAERIGKERELMIKEQERLSLARADLKKEREGLEEERERLMKLVDKSESVNEKRLKKLAGIYGAMKAKEAARIMSTLDDSLCIEVFKYMNEDRQKAKIVASMPQDKASRLSKKMGIQIK